jgi:HD superfamily phosphohydrolase
MDRLDYLRRDSFFTGVTEGNIGSARIIKMLNVVDDNLVIDHKGIYSIENYLTSRRLMYWQVYLHKTTVAYEKLLVNTLRRAKKLAMEGQQIFASPALSYFLYNDVDAAWFQTHHEALDQYCMLDDSDIWSALKVWCHSNDKILSVLAKDLLDRRIFKVEIREELPTEEELKELKTSLATHYNICEEDAGYLMSLNTIQKDMYDIHDDHISILYNDGTLKDIAEASEILNVQLLSKKIRKYYLCYQRMS